MGKLNSTGARFREALEEGVQQATGPSFETCKKTDLIGPGSFLMCSQCRRQSSQAQHQKSVAGAEATPQKRKYADIDA